MDLKEVIEKLKEHGIKCSIFNKFGESFIKLSGNEKKPSVHQTFDQDDFDDIVPWIQKMTLKWYGVEIK
jgi:hypothetical protein